jgi:hypothetical protein
MSSHREAPEISKDPVADNTDIYAFVSPDRPDTVTILANYIPLQQPMGGPNFYEFSDEVLYEIHISNSRDARADISFQFRFRTVIRNEDTFLYNTGPITAIGSTNWNRPQFYSVTRVERGRAPHVLATDLAVPPVNVGIRSTPDYATVFTAAAVHGLPNGGLVFAGQRAEGFNVDLGSIFDLGALRPFQELHLIPSAAAVGVNGTQGLNVHSIALQLKITDLTRDGSGPTDPARPESVIGVWASASRQTSRVFDARSGKVSCFGGFRQVSRLGNPLFNEVIVPMAHKDAWNRTAPNDDKLFASYVLAPELARLLPVLYPGVFGHLAAYTKPRADLAAILLTGIPSGVVPGFQNYTGPIQADMLRLNVAVPPTANPNSFGLLGGDAAGYPNGRRPVDDVVTIELRAVGGLTIPLVDPSYVPDGAVQPPGGINDGTTNTNPPFLTSFPYLGTPASGSESTPGTAVA